MAVVMALPLQMCEARWFPFFSLKIFYRSVTINELFANDYKGIKCENLKTSKYVYWRKVGEESEEVHRNCS